MTFCTIVEFEWDEGFHHAAFAQQSAPLLATARLPPPTRVTGFEVTSYEVA